MLSGMQLAPSFPMASYAPQSPVSHGPILVPSAAVPVSASPFFHRPLTAFPAAALSEPRAPMGVPYFSGAGIPARQTPVPLASSGILAQSMPAVARQGKIKPDGIRILSFLYIMSASNASVEKLHEFAPVGKVSEWHKFVMTGHARKQFKFVRLLARLRHY